jgi:hypothetical protein
MAAPFLRHFREMRARGASEAEMLARYRELHPWLDDDTQALSWFRDQVQHPHETQHTLAEFLPLMRARGMELVATSINRFQPIGSINRAAEVRLCRARRQYGGEPVLPRVLHIPVPQERA